MKYLSNILINQSVNNPEFSYILGNPPFGGKQYQTEKQKEDIAYVFSDVVGSGVLDFVSPWYRKAAKFMKCNKTIKTHMYQLILLLKVSKLASCGRI